MRPGEVTKLAGVRPSCATAMRADAPSSLRRRREAGRAEPSKSISWWPCTPVYHDPACFAFPVRARLYCVGT